MECQEHRTTNYKVIVVFIALGIREKRIEPVPSDRPGSQMKGAFIYDAENQQVKDILSKWRNGDPIIVEARQLFNAQGEFHLRVQNRIAEFQRAEEEESITRLSTK